MGVLGIGDGGSGGGDFLGWAAGSSMKGIVSGGKWAGSITRVSLLNVSCVARSSTDVQGANSRVPRRLGGGDAVVML
jgi:hypothetical protein